MSNETQKPLTPEELAERWDMTSNRLAIWRMEGKGPAYFKVGSKVRYSTEAVEKYERENTTEPKEKE